VARPPGNHGEPTSSGQARHRLASATWVVALQELLGVDRRSSSTSHCSPEGSLHWPRRDRHDDRPHWQFVRPLFRFQGATGAETIPPERNRYSTRSERWPCKASTLAITLSSRG
jgi:hypothetical protein